MTIIEETFRYSRAHEDALSLGIHRDWFEHGRRPRDPLLRGQLLAPEQVAPLQADSVAQVGSQHELSA